MQRIVIQTLRFQSVRPIMTTIAERLTNLNSEIEKEAEKASRSVRLIAVSKTKPEEDIIEAYEAGQRDFGENYPNELKAKSASAKIAELCPEIRWHFIGTIQKKSLNHILKADKLTGIQTVTSIEVIDMIEKRLNNEVNIMLQVNTSNEEQKGGFRSEEDLISAVNHLLTSCKYCKFEGLMTIGSAENSKMAAETGGPNPDFTRLCELKKIVAEKCSVPETEIVLSMGMSTDYLRAIEQGANVVRVGSKIFGARDYAK